jgi:hypothetical protein
MIQSNALKDLFDKKSLIKRGLAVSKEVAS